MLLGKYALSQTTACEVSIVSTPLVKKGMGDVTLLECLPYLRCTLLCLIRI